MHVHGSDGAGTRALGAGLPGRAPGTRSCLSRGRTGHRGDLPGLWGVRAGTPDSARASTLMADHSHPTAARKVLFAAAGQPIEAEPERLAGRMTAPPSGTHHSAHTLDVHRPLPLSSVL